MKMLKPELEVIEFNTEDVITTSGESVDLLDGTLRDYIPDDANGKSLTQDYIGLKWNITQ